MTERKRYVFEEFLGDDASACVDSQLHLADLFVDFLHEMDDKVHQLVLIHLLRVEVGDEEADVIALIESERGEKKR